MKRAIHDKFRRENGLEFKADEVTAAVGAKQILYKAMMANLNEGDEVIIPTPC
jgi:aspartate aminotransferase